MSLRVFSFGGGVQSVACLVLSAQGKIDYKTHLFANVGNDSEHPATIEYLHKVAIPYATAHGIQLVITEKRRRNGEVETLYEHIMQANKSLPIPVRMNLTGAPGNRSCTVDWKVKVVSAWTKKHGATASSPATIGIGISLDEFQRARRDSGVAWQTLDYPLIDLRMSRSDCQQIIASAGLPVPPKSSCWFCPFHDLAAWQGLYDEYPELFRRAVQLELTLNERRARLGRDPVWLTRFGRPLDEVVTGAHTRQGRLFDNRQPHEWRHSCGPFACSQTDERVTDDESLTQLALRRRQQEPKQ